MSYFLRLWSLSVLVSAMVVAIGISVFIVNAAPDAVNLLIFVTGLSLAVLVVSLAYTFALHRYLLPRKIVWTPAEIIKYALLYIGIAGGGLLLQLVAHTLFGGASFLALVLGFGSFVAMWWGVSLVANYLFPTDNAQGQRKVKGI